jgi:hypothetical protein
MNINNFETYIDNIILDRGLDYYVSGSVISLEHDGTDWVADVEGSQNYTVTVTLSKNNNITDSTCDCPYDYGNYCKHQAAVFYMLRDEINDGTLSKKKEKNKELEDLLEKLDKKILVSIIMETARKDRRMKEQLFLHYEKHGDTLKYARNVIRNSIDAAKNRGFVEYAYVRSSTIGADSILEMIDDGIDSEDIEMAVSLSIIVLEEMMDLLGYCDDSNGTVGGCINEAVAKITKAVSSKKLSQKDNEKLFKIIFDYAQDKTFDGWTDWRFGLLYALLPLCGNRVNRAKMEYYLSNQKSTDKSEWSENYEKRQLQKLQYEILKRFDGETIAESYMEKHLDNSDFRKIIIQNAISQGLYEKALNLCLEGEQMDSSYAGLVREWKEYRYIIYEKTNDTPSQKLLGTEFLLNNNYEYYVKLKALYTKKEWPEILRYILEKTKNERHGIYVKILIQEKLKPQLLEYCKQNIYTITEHYKHLLPDYKNDVSSIFASYINQCAERANNRHHYKDVCEIIQLYKKACTKAAYEIRDELAKKYIRRPAFLDELSKL